MSDRSSIPGQTQVLSSAALPCLELGETEISQKEPVTNRCVSDKGLPSCVLQDGRTPEGLLAFPPSPPLSPRPDLTVSQSPCSPADCPRGSDSVRIFPAGATPQKQASAWESCQGLREYQDILTPTSCCCTPRGSREQTALVLSPAPLWEPQGAPASGLAQPSPRPPGSVNPGTTAPHLPVPLPQINKLKNNKYINKGSETPAKAPGRAQTLHVPPEGEVTSLPSLSPS